MNKATMRRLVKTAKRVNPGMSDSEARELAERVAASLAERSRREPDPAWEGCR